MSSSGRLVPRYSTRLRGRTSRPSTSASVSARRWVSTMPTTTWTPRPRTSAAWVSIANVLPTPAHAPKKIFRRPERCFASARCTVASNLSGSGRSAMSRLYVRRLWRAERIEREVQLQHVDARLAEDRPLPPFGVSTDEVADAVLGQSTDARDARDLVRGGGRADVRIES